MRQSTYKSYLEKEREEKRGRKEKKEKKRERGRVEDYQKRRRGGEERRVKETYDFL